MDVWQVGGLVILAGLVLVAAVVVPLWIGYYILHPVDVRMRRCRGRIQFTVADFLCLLIQLQIALAFALSQVPKWNSRFFVLIFGFLGSSVLLIWLGGVFSLSRLSVQSAKRRMALLMALPAIVVAMMAAAAAFGSASIFALHKLRRDWVFDLPLDLSNGWRVTLIVAGTLVATVSASRWLRRFVGWAVTADLAGAGEGDSS